MDILSFVIFSIYTILILIVILYISPVLSAFLMFIVPAGLVYFMPTEMIQFLSTKQFSFDSILIQNIHVLVIIWSAIMGVIAYSEILSWYLFKKQGQGAKQCESLVKKGVLIEKGKGKFAYIESPAPKQTTTLEMMWDFAEHKTNKKLIADDVFNFYAEEKKRGELLKTINDFIDYYKIEKNTENLVKWEKNFSNALIIQGISQKWDTS